MFRLACAGAPPLETLLTTAIEQKSANFDYWCIDRYYALDGESIDRILVPAAEELWGLCWDFVGAAVADERILSSLGIPSVAWDAVRASWARKDPLLFARFDLSFDGRSPPKLHECNIDVVGMIYETAIFQKEWLRYQKERGLIEASACQFTDLARATAGAIGRMIGKGVVQLSSLDDDPYDNLWSYSILRILSGAGIDCGTRRHASANEFLRSLGNDATGAIRPHIIKSFRWDHLMHDELLATRLDADGLRIASPLWSLVLSSKGSLAWLWRFNPGHPNLLAAFFEPGSLADSDGLVSKPLFSIQGQGIMLCDRRTPARNMATSGADAVRARVFQDLHYLPQFGDDGQGPWASTAAWIVGGRAVAIGMTECDCPVITDAAMRYVPHVLT